MAVVEVDGWRSEPYAEGRSFGAAGPADIRFLRLHHAVDPGDPANRRIVDLDRADHDGQGLVNFDHDVVIVQPRDPAARNGWAIVDVVNRGSPTIPAFLLGDNSPLFPQPEQPPAGDGYLLAEGWTLVYAGWQFDIAAPSALGLRAPAVHDGDGGELAGGSPTRWCPRWVAPPAPHVARPSGVAGGPRDHTGAAGGRCGRAGGGVEPVGQWLDRAATRGVHARLHVPLRVRDGRRRRGRVRPAGVARRRPLAAAGEGVRRALLFGVSQSGRLVRQFLHDGLNVDEAGTQVYDAVMPVIAGGRRGQFNQRFAVPAACRRAGTASTTTRPTAACWPPATGSPATPAAPTPRSWPSTRPASTGGATPGWSTATHPRRSGSTTWPARSTRRA